MEQVNEPGCQTWKKNVAWPLTGLVAWNKCILDEVKSEAIKTRGGVNIHLT
jgi:hypothetical protein